jgi:integrase
MNADTAGKHAVDGSRKDLFFTIRMIESPEYQALAWLIMATGGRARDLARLRREQVRITARAIFVQWRWTKNIRIRAHLRFVGYDLKNMYGCPRRALEFLRLPRRLDEMIFTDKPVYAAGKLNKALKEVSGNLFTTYSFRRAFMFQTLDECGGDFERAKQFTLHRNAATTAAFYAEWQKVNHKGE